MEIKIYKNSNEKICFQLNQIEYEFKYESFDVLIDAVYNNDDEVKYITDEGLEEYEKLIDGIVKGSRTTDYRTAIEDANKSKKELEQAESDLNEKSEDDENE